jgi:hypothetical protein
MVGSGCRSYLSLQSRSPTGFKAIYLDLMFGPDAGRAGERSFRDFFRLPPTKENRSQSVDPACRLCGELHWQVAGPTFYQLHLLYDKHYGEQVEAADSDRRKNSAARRCQFGDGGRSGRDYSNRAPAAWSGRSPSSVISIARCSPNYHSPGLNAGAARFCTWGLWHE